MITKKQATKLRKLIRDYAWYSGQAEVAAGATEQGNYDYLTLANDAYRALMAYIKSLESAEA